MKRLTKAYLRAKRQAADAGGQRPAAKK
jgi:hypothetical protein